MSANAFIPQTYLYLYLYLQHNPLSLSTELYLMVHPDTLQRHTGVVINLFRLIYSLCCSQRFERNKSSELPLPSVELSSQCHSAGLLDSERCDGVGHSVDTSCAFWFKWLVLWSFLTPLLQIRHRRMTQRYCYRESYIYARPDPAGG